MMPTDRDIFFATFDMWSEKVSLLSSITPRYRKESTIGKGVTFMSKGRAPMQSTSSVEQPIELLSG